MIFAILRTMESAVHPSLLSERQDWSTPSLLPLLDAVLRQELWNSPLLSPGCSLEFSASFCETVSRLWGTESSTKFTMASGHLDSVGVSIGALHLLPQIPVCRVTSPFHRSTAFSEVGLLCRTLRLLRFLLHPMMEPEVRKSWSTHGSPTGCLLKLFISCPFTMGCRLPIFVFASANARRAPRKGGITQRHKMADL